MANGPWFSSEHRHQLHPFHGAGQGGSSGPLGAYLNAATIEFAMWLMTGLPSRFLTCRPNSMATSLLLPHSLRFTKNIGSKRASLRRLRALDFGSPAPKSTSPPAAAGLPNIPLRLARHCPASSHQKQDDPVERAGPHAADSPKPVFLSWKWAGVAA
jgi:hypothetical protein